MPEKSKIMSMSEVAKEIKREDSMTETEKALAETMKAGEQSVKEQAQEKIQKQQETKEERKEKIQNFKESVGKWKEKNTTTVELKKKEIEMVKKSEGQRAEYLQAVQEAKNVPDTENTGVNEAVDIRAAYNAAANVDPEAERERIATQQKLKKEAVKEEKEEKLAKQEVELEKTLQSGEAEIQSNSKPETKPEEKVILKKETEDALKEAQKVGAESIEADKEIEKQTSLEELTKKATANIENKKAEETPPEEILDIQQPEKLSEMLKDDEEKEKNGTEITPEWQNLEKELDTAPTKEELEILPEITELEPLPIRGIGEMIKNTPMDSDTKEWLLAHRGALKKVNDTEGSESQKIEMLLQGLTSELEEKELKLKKTWFFGKGKLKTEIKRLNEIINNSTLFKTGEATRPRNSSRMNRGSEKSSGFASKV